LWTSGRVVDLQLGYRPEAAVSGAVLLQTEQFTIVTFNAMEPTPTGTYATAGTAIVEFRLCSVTRFGYPNDEARAGIPQYRGVSYGIYEVVDSSWITELVQLNRHSFPSTPDDHTSRHFILAFHDSTFECIAEDMTIRVTREPYDRVMASLQERVAGE
jgi:hypothetical protein